MPPKVGPCGVCHKKEGAKYRCPVDHVEYKEVSETHKQSNCSTEKSYTAPEVPLLAWTNKADPADDRPRKKLKSLQWPAEPDAALWDDPLQRNDLKPLRNFEYEAVATSRELRILLANPELVATLTRLQSLPAHDRTAFMRLLLGLAADVTPVNYRPSPFQRFETSLNGTKGKNGSNDSRASAQGKFHAQPRGTRQGNESPVDGLLSSTPEERILVTEFAEEISTILSKVRNERGERS